jgi:hypothetical protein
MLSEDPRAKPMHLQNGPQVAELHAAAPDVQKTTRRRNVYNLRLQA